MERKKVYVVGNQKQYVSWLKDFLDLVDTIEECDLVVFTGGEDVNPKLYKDSTHPTTRTNYERDVKECVDFFEAQKLNKKCLGICRGSQFLCVMSGGLLIQDVNNHTTNHNIRYFDGSIFNVTSTHHQMQFPYNLNKEDYDLLAYSEELSDKWEKGNSDDIDFPEEAYTVHNKIMEAEVVYYNKTQCLAIQSHPEYMESSSTAVIKFKDLIKCFVTDNINKYLLQLT